MESQERHTMPLTQHNNMHQQSLLGKERLKLFSSLLIPDQAQHTSVAGLLVCSGSRLDHRLTEQTHVWYQPASHLQPGQSFPVAFLLFHSSAVPSYHRKLLILKKHNEEQCSIELS